jgi:hypothetical protein
MKLRNHYEVLIDGQWIGCRWAMPVPNDHSVIRYVLADYSCGEAKRGAWRMLQVAVRVSATRRLIFWLKGIKHVEL